MPPGRARPPSVGRGSAHDSRSVKDWLNEVGDGGVLQQYHDAISNSYKSVIEVCDAHRSPVAGGSPLTLDDFFAQVGVKKAGHRRLFQHWFAKLHPLAPPPGGCEPTETRVEAEKSPVADGQDVTQLVQEWLKQIDESGALQQYVQQISAMCRGGDDVLHRYVEIGATGCPSLSERFFDDSGVRKKGHQRLFRQWLAKSSAELCAVGSEDGQLPRRRTQAEQVMTVPNELVDVSRVEEPCTTHNQQNADLHAPAGLTGSEREEMVSWLTSLDPAGSVQQYCDSILQCCSSVEGLQQKYVSVQLGCKPVLKAGFFADSGIKRKGHQRLFERWADQLDTTNKVFCHPSNKVCGLPPPSKCSEMDAEAARLPQEIVEAFMADPSAQMFEVVADGDDKGVEVFLSLCEMKGVEWQKMRDEEGQNLLEVAHVSKHSVVARALVQRGAREPLFAVITHSDLEAEQVRELIREGVVADSHAAAAAARLPDGPRRTDLLAVLGDKDKAGEWLSEALSGTSREWVSALTAARAYGTKMRVV